MPQDKEKKPSKFMNGLKKVGKLTYIAIIKELFKEFFIEPVKSFFE